MERYWNVCLNQGSRKGVEFTPGGLHSPNDLQDLWMMEGKEGSGCEIPDWLSQDVS